MTNLRLESSDSDQSRDLADLLEAELKTLPQRRLVLARPIAHSPPPGAWAPGQFSVQIPLSGSIELAIPDQDGVPHWQIIDRRHLLIVCAGGWSPRRMTTARRHLAFNLAAKIYVHQYHTQVGVSGQAPERKAVLQHPEADLQAVIAAAHSCSNEAASGMVLHSLAVAAIPLIIAHLRAERPTALARISAYLADHCHEDLQRDVVAAHFGMSGDHLTRLLQRHHGRSFIEDLHLLRLQRACRLLADKHRSISAIATDCGFGSSSYFIRIFRRHHSCTPQQWRRRWLLATANPAAAGT